jgi:hypothetical protein
MEEVHFHQFAPEDEGTLLGLGSILCWIFIVMSFIATVATAAYSKSEEKTLEVVFLSIATVAGACCAMCMTFRAGMKWNLPARTPILGDEPPQPLIDTDGIAAALGTKQ